MLFILSLYLFRLSLIVTRLSKPDDQRKKEEETHFISWRGSLLSKINIQNRGFYMDLNTNFNH